MPGFSCSGGGVGVGGCLSGVSGAAGEVRGQDVAACASGEREGGGGGPAEVPERAAVLGDGLGVLLSAGGVRPAVSNCGVVQEPDDLRGAGGAVRRPAVLLLHHERLVVVGRGGRPGGEPAVRPGEPACPTVEWCPCVADAIGQSGEQLGVYGDRVAGVDAEGVDGVGSSGVASVETEARIREAVALAYGVPDVPERVHARAVPDHPQGPAADLPVVVVESVAVGVLACGRGGARSAVLSRRNRCRGTDAPIRRGHYILCQVNRCRKRQPAPDHSSRRRPAHLVRAARTGPPRAKTASKDRLFKG